jgi:hypothetical protein
MKKWHMEGIISITETTSRKLVLPDSHHMYRWSTAFSHEPRKEFVLIILLRNMVTFFLRNI